MREMKDSGVEWIGKIPCLWNKNPIRNIVVSRDGGAWGEEPDENNVGTICLRIADFDYEKGEFKSTAVEELTHRIFSDAQIYRLRLKKNDILVEKSGGGEKTPVGRTVIFNKDYEALFANFMDRLKIDAKSVTSLFVEYWFRALYACRVTPFYIKQTTGIQNLDLSMMLAKEKIFFPTINQQDKITNYLNNKCSEIDALTADIQAQIDVLEQYKRSVITEAVTKGLNPDAEMKDSGIEWCMSIPQHWGVMPNKYLMKKRKNICPIYDGEDILSLTMNGVIVRDLDAGGKMPASFDGYQRVTAGNLLMCLFDIDVTPRCIGLIKNDGLTSPAYSQFQVNKDGYAPYYYFYYLMLDFTKELLHMAKNLRHSLTEDQLGAISIPVPPVSEQIAIATYLENKCAGIDIVIADKQSQLATLDEYKKSLIFEYVTGKKEVPVS